MERLGFSRLTGSMIPSTLEFNLRLEPYPYNAVEAKRLLDEGKLFEFKREFVTRRVDAGNPQKQPGGEYQLTYTVSGKPLVATINSVCRK